MSMRYAKEKELTSNQGDKIGGCIPDVEVDIDGVKVDPMSDENVLEEDCVMKDDSQRGNKFMDIRHVNDELIKKNNVIDKKKNRVVNKLNKRKLI
ncbi:33800_t:CDS:2 [Gigaspora margarita]|uniref:33800_t:CDS:1 n=1 Tax=Gigaspora margarita TaxID=4874 RepID=A0ABN7UTC6_GIGMA|nr:33800_t:CDS:2 [Gigaspora margarita]